MFRFSSYFTLGWIIIPLVFVFSNIIILEKSLVASIFVPIIICLALLIVTGEIYARMAYNRWLFEFASTNLKKEHGIIWKTYSNIPYERIQNVDIRRGIVARIFGFSSVMIQTAGYSTVAHGAGAEGYIPAVSPESAEKIRDFLMHKISKKGGSGGLE